MATFSYIADYTANRTIKPRVRALKFGDGYEQRTADGINTQPATWALSFNARTTTEADAIESFLSTHAGITVFDWTPPVGAAGRYICREWNRVCERFNINSVTCTFEQVYE